MSSPAINTVIKMIESLPLSESECEAKIASYKPEIIS